MTGSLNGIGGASFSLSLGLGAGLGFCFG